jgi:exodeoxyribonuclease VII small subunit
MAPKARKFEDELRDLEEIVNRIDSGDLSLEESIAAFERGVALVRSLNLKLDEVERKVEVLTRTAQGDLRTDPFDDLPRSNAAQLLPEDAPAENSADSVADDDDEGALRGKDDDIPF